MKKWLKILLGLLSLWPFLYVMFFFVFMFYAFFFIPELGTTGSSPPKVLIAIIPIHILTMLLIIGLTLFYIVDVFRNNRVDKDKKALWAVVLFMGSMFAMPVYWYLYIWRDSVVDGSRGSSTLGSANASGYLKEVNAPNREHQYVPPAQPPNWRE